MGSLFQLTIKRYLTRRIMKYSQLSESRVDLKNAIPLKRPFTILIEPANICNLKCPLCATGSGTLKRDKGMISNDDYLTLLNKIPIQTKNIYLKIPS